MKKLSQKEKRTLKFGLVCAVIIVAFAFGTKGLDNWKQARSSRADITKKLKAVNIKEPERAKLMSIVPVFEMPQKEERQKYLFRDKFNEQLRNARIKSEPLQVLPPSNKSGVAGYELLRLKCSAKCSFGQALDLLAKLKENPYLAGIEEFKIECDQKKRQDVKLDLTISTFIISRKR